MHSENKELQLIRSDGRGPRDLRKIIIIPRVNPYAEGSAEISFGKTKVLITATVEKEVPKWMQPGEGGWITAEYGMLPRSTMTRNKREAAMGKQGGRTLEIQRIIGRALRQAIDLRALEGITIRIDCDVFCADGGTRTAAITGAWVALWQALKCLKDQGIISSDLVIKNIAAISVGKVKNQSLVDLCYEEDSKANFDLNLVFDQEMRIIEIQGTGERASLSHEEILELINIGKEAVTELFKLQTKAIS